MNLIGDHTDYNDGFVLPFAVPHRIAVAAAPRQDGTLQVTTVGDDGKPQRARPVRVAELEPGSVTGWAAFPAGVAWALTEQGIGHGAGADLVIAGDVPAGAGLASSAALECAVVLALVELDPQAARVARPELARCAQHAENDFVGAPTGLLDQLASLCCAAGMVLFLDVRTVAAEQVRLDTAAAGIRMLVIDTRASHAHSESAYGDRRRGCERAARLLGVPALRDVEADVLATRLAELPAELRPLVRHVVSENERVLATVELLRQGKVAEIGPLLSASHESLRDDYQVSTDELDTAVDAALDAGAIGARMTGGGFGGSVVALVPDAAMGAVHRALVATFAQRRFTEPKLFTATPAAGAGRDW